MSEDKRTESLDMSDLMNDDDDDVEHIISSLDSEVRQISNSHSRSKKKKSRRRFRLFAPEREI